ncbi:MAG TPA: sulfatase [Kofleriaceae bacterium]|jgi:arylsulfatase A-like enzyme|nr:sulfatase [Kofleriaceae bacterium]
MIDRACRVTIALALAAAACSKTTGEPAPSRDPGELPRADHTARTAPADKPVTAPAQVPVPSPASAAASGGDHAVYSLVDNRLSAHLTRGGGLVVPAGSAGFAKYVRFANVMKSSAKKAWELRQTEGDVKVARLTGKTATMFVPLTAAEAGRPKVALRAFAKADTTVSLRINDNKDLNAKLAAGWSTVGFNVPAGQLKDGENALQLFMKSSGVEVAWLQVGATTPVGDDGATTFYDPAKKALILPRDGQMSWYVAIPAKARLIGDVADPSCAIHVAATADDGATAEGKLAGAGAVVDLAALGGKAVRLDLEATGCASAAVANAALAVPGEAPAARRGDPPKFVVFVIMDSLRADRVRTFNPKARAETPNFDKLAENSTLFMSNYVQGNESQVSHAAMWSSNYLAKHKAIEMSDHLADKWMTIDEVAKKAGKFTAGASGNGYIRPSRGFGSGWDKYVNHIEKGLGLRGADILEKGLSFVQPKKDQPWFLYLGFIDTHVTWRAKQPWLDKYDGGYKGRFATELGDDGPGGFPKDLTDREKDHVRALYDSNVSYQDDLIGQLIEKLKGWGIWDQTMLIITADHGDEQWEDGRVGHGGSERETLLHVPLVIHYPPLFPAARVTEGTEGIDIVPTLADALGVQLDPEWQGMSLIKLANGGGGYPLMSFSSQYENAHGGRIGHWKLKLIGTQTPKLYDLAKDAGEREDVWGKPSSEIGARLLLDPMWILRSWNVEWKKSQWGNASAVTSRFAADLGE